MGVRGRCSGLRLGTIGVYRLRLHRRDGAVSGCEGARLFTDAGRSLETNGCDTRHCLAISRSDHVAHFRVVKKAHDSTPLVDIASFNVERFIGTNKGDYIYIERADAGSKPYVAGGEGDDILLAPGGVMRGGDGDDKLYGDVDYVDTFWLALDGDTDQVDYFTDDQDKIRISGKEFGIGALMSGNEIVNKNADSSPVGTHAQFIFRTDSDQLFFDPDGTGDEATILVADFDSNSPIAYLYAYEFEIV